MAHSYDPNLLVVKMENGNVVLYDNGTGDFIISFSPDIVGIEVLEDDRVKVLFENGSFQYFYTAKVISTQIEPAAAIVFAGDTNALAVLLATSFFFVASGGGAGAAIDVTYDNTVSGLAATNAQDAIDELAAAAGGYPISYPVGFYTNFNRVSANVSSAFVASNFYYGMIQEVLKTVSISAPRLRVAGAVAGNGIVALYKYNGTQWILVDQTNAFNTAVGGVAVLAWLTGTLVLQPGVYCWCINTSTSPSLETIVIPALSNYFGQPLTMAAQSRLLQLHSSAYTGTALATMPLALSSVGFVPNILNLIM